MHLVKFWVGVSGFSYPKWRGKFYPKDTKSDKLLEAYSTKLNSVEVNSSFYNTPTEKTILKWAASVGEDFRFSFKANRHITHYKKLKNTQPEIDYLTKALTNMGQKFGCLLVQLPPYLKSDNELLETFLKGTKDSNRIALEFRNDSWFIDKTYALLTKYNAALCVADTEEMKPVLQKTANFTYTRLRRDKYSELEMKGWAKKLSAFSQDTTDCYVYFRHDEPGDAANAAVKFKEILEAL